MLVYTVIWPAVPVPVPSLTSVELVWVAPAVRDTVRVPGFGSLAA